MDSPSLKLCPLTHSGPYLKQKAQDIKRHSASIIKAPVKPFNTHMNPEKVGLDETADIDPHEIVSVSAFMD